MDMTLDPRKPEIQTDLGTSPAQMGGPEDAEAAIRQAIEIAPWDAGRSATGQLTGKPGQARGSFRGRAAGEPN